MIRIFISALIISVSLFSSAFAQHRLITQGNGRLAVVEKDGEISWEMPWQGIHDIHVLDNGNIMVQQGGAKVVEIDPAKKEVVWTYDSEKQNRDGDGRVEVHAFQSLDDGNIMIAESGPARIIEVTRDGKIAKQIKLKVDNPHPHTDTRLARKLDSGNYLVCHEGDGTIREYDGEGKVVWEYPVPMFDKKPKNGHGPEAFGNKAFCALRMKNGNTLIATGNGHSVIEVTPEKKVVWQIHQNDLPKITLAWVTTLEILPNGNYMIGNCHAGPKNPLLIELNPKTKEVVWTLDEFEKFGNSVSNSKILDLGSIGDVDFDMLIGMELADFVARNRVEQALVWHTPSLPPNSDSETTYFFDDGDLVLLVDVEGKITSAKFEEQKLPPRQRLNKVHRAWSEHLRQRRERRIRTL